MVRDVLLAFAFVGLVGCSTYSSNMQVGNDQAYTSLADQRAAAVGVRVVEEVPPGATSLGEISAGRCHRSWVEEAPSEESLLLDLKIAAYARGADAITGVRTEKTSALNKNCWYMLDGRATALRIAEPSMPK